MFFSPKRTVVELLKSMVLMGGLLFVLFQGFKVNSADNPQDGNLFLVDEVIKNSNDKIEFLTHDSPRKLFSVSQSDFGEIQIFSGDLIYYPGEFVHPSYPKSLKEFNYHRYLEGIGVDSLVRLESPPVIVSRQMGLAYYSENVKRYLISCFLVNDYLTFQSKGVLIALITGERGFLKRTEKQLFREAGIVHVLAISGMHVGIVYAFVLVLLKLFRISKIASFCIMTIILVFYAFVTGLSPSVIRAVLMFILFQIGSLNRSRVKSINYVVMAAVLMLIWECELLFDVGFQLSFSAVFGILFMLERWKGVKGKGLMNYPLTLLKVNSGAFLFTLPIISYHFGLINFSSLWMSFLIVPFISVLLCMGLFLLVFPIYHFYQSCLINYFVDFILSAVNIGVRYKLKDLCYSMSEIEVLVFFTIVLLFLLRKNKWIPIVVLIYSFTLFIPEEIEIEALEVRNKTLELRIENQYYLLHPNDQVILEEKGIVLGYLPPNDKAVLEGWCDSKYLTNSEFFIEVNSGDNVDSISVDKYILFNLANYIKNP